MMEDLPKELVAPADIWQVWGVKDWESYKRLEPMPAVSAEVPETVRKRIGRVHRLLDHSYFDYDFLEFAVEHTVGTVELSLRLFYSKHCSNPPRRAPSLKTIVNWMVHHGAFGERAGRLDSFRKVRNRFAHPSSYQLLGYPSFSFMRVMHEWINDLFEYEGGRQMSESTND